MTTYKEFHQYSIEKPDEFWPFCLFHLFPFIAELVWSQQLGTTSPGFLLYQECPDAPVDTLALIEWKQFQTSRDSPCP